ncbi:hypothetical protein GQ457_09G027640 [Hibiscus cannabinus]
MLNAYWRFEMVSYCWVLVWDKFEWISGYFGCESDAKSSYNVELMFAASFDSKMGCLYSVFDVKKQGKTVWVVRARNWKLREGENRLSGLLEGVSGNEEILPPPSVGGEVNVGSAGLWGSVGPQVAQGPAAGDMMSLVQVIARAFQIAMAGVQVVAQPQSGGYGLPLERHHGSDGVRFRGLPARTSGSSSNREVEFVIETQTDSAPVSISPYRRSPKELKELKTQLQELLDRRFIRLSTSTWGTPTDLRFRYYQLKVKEQDVLKTAFRTNGCFLKKRLRKCVRFEWSDARQQAFEKLKEALTNAPVLIQPVSEKELYMRQRRWLELLKDYDLSVEYHPVDLRKAVARQYFNISCVSIAEASIQRAPVCWAETRQKLSPLVDILKGTTEKVKLICDQLKIASDRQKSYVDLKCREIEYVVGDRVFLKVSPWKKVMRFGRKGKLSPRYIGSYEIVERVGSVAYRLLLPPELERIHDVFHVSMLRKYRSDPSHVMPVEEIELNPDLSYDEEPVEILASDSKVLRGRTIELVKVKWRHRGVEEATWERKEDMMEQFPYLFPSGNFEDEISLSGGEL